MAPSNDIQKPAPPESRDGQEIPAGNPPPLQGWADLWKAYARAYGPYSFGMLIVVSIMGGTAAVGWLIWWLTTR